MFGIFDKIEEFFKELLLGGIQANLESMFLDINDKVGAVATDVGKTPMGWNGDVFAFIFVFNSLFCYYLLNRVARGNVCRGPGWTSWFSLLFYL